MQLSGIFCVPTHQVKLYRLVTLTYLTRLASIKFSDSLWAEH